HLHSGLQLHARPLVHEIAEQGIGLLVEDRLLLGLRIGDGDEINVIHLHAELAHEGREDRQARVARGDRNAAAFDLFDLGGARRIRPVDKSHRALLECHADRFNRHARADGSMRIDANADGRWTLVPVTVRDWRRNPLPAPPLNFALDALPPLSFGDNALAALLTPPPPPTNRLAGLGARPYLDDPLARTLGLGGFLDPVPQKR